MYDLSHPFCLRNLFVFFTIGRDLELSDPTYRLDRNFPVKSLPSTHPAFSDGKLSSFLLFPQMMIGIHTICGLSCIFMIKDFWQDVEACLKCFRLCSSIPRARIGHLPCARPWSRDQRFF